MIIISILCVGVCSKHTNIINIDLSFFPIENYLLEIFKFSFYTFICPIKDYYMDPNMYYGKLQLSIRVSVTIRKGEYSIHDFIKRSECVLSVHDVN